MSGEVILLTWESDQIEIFVMLKFDLFLITKVCCWYFNRSLIGMGELQLSSS